MYQYEFELRRHEGRREHVLVTSQTMEKARQAVVDAYAPQFAVSEGPTDAYPAHLFVGEIDASE